MVGTFNSIEFAFLLVFFFFDIFLFFTGICFWITSAQHVKTNIAITEMEKQWTTEYEACWRSSTRSNLTKGESTSIFLTVFSATDPCTTVFSVANLSTIGPSTIISFTTIPSTFYTHANSASH